MVQSPYNLSFSGGNVTNPYYSATPANNKTLSQYGWNGIFNKNNQPSGALNFTDVEFANDINSILDASGGLSEANVVSSYTNGVLTIRGFQSSTIDFSITDGDCILMETNGTGGSGGSGTSWFFRYISGSSGTSGNGTSGSSGTSGNGTSGSSGTSGNGTSGSSGTSGTSSTGGTTSVIASSSGGLAVTTANNQAVISLDICSNLDDR